MTLLMPLTPRMLLGMAVIAALTSMWFVCAVPQQPIGIDCQFKDSQGRYYDFSPLANNTGDYSIRSGSSLPAVIVEFNLCRKMVSYPHFYSVVSASGMASSLGDEEAIGDLPSGVEGAQFNITNGIICRGSSSGKTSATILVFCDPTATTPEVKDPLPVGGCSFQASVYSQHACALNSSSVVH
eukprot:TRINITY_DN6330_c0_g2_i1.p1 TRINITY_DN6330_c0_g2~~TRINITY_DN6330_c0_g2_i1.p1  ORF type:complete len:198 (-),score=33.67 TRINITY_DN6330_c0_g2_i1:223-771(-)